VSVRFPDATVKTLDIRMRARHGDTLGGCKQADKRNIARPRVFSSEPRRRKKGTAGTKEVPFPRQHRINQDHGTVGQIVRRLEVLFHTPAGIADAVEADIARHGAEGNSASMQ